jgi:hypothetical protein
VGDPQKWLGYNGKSYNKSMVLGFPHFRKPYMSMVKILVSWILIAGKWMLVPQNMVVSYDFIGFDLGPMILYMRI